MMWERAGGLDDVGSKAQGAYRHEVWLRGGEMPTPGHPRPARGLMGASVALTPARCIHLQLYTYYHGSRTGGCGEGESMVHSPNWGHIVYERLK